jgi:hypothetical protein
MASPPDLSVIPFDFGMPVDAGAPVDLGAPLAPVYPPNAGTIVASARGMIQLVPSLSGYGAASGGEPLWSAGDNLSVRAAGDSVPGFSVDLIGPSALRLDSAPMGTTFSTEPRFTWSGAQSGSAVLALNGGCTSDLTGVPSMRGGPLGSATGAIVGAFAVCDFGGDTGGTVPIDALRLFPLRESIDYSLCARSRVAVQAGGYDVNVVALTPAASGTGTFQLP